MIAIYKLTKLTKEQVLYTNIIKQKIQEFRRTSSKFFRKLIEKVRQFYFTRKQRKDRIYRDSNPQSTALKSSL